MTSDRSAVTTQARPRRIVVTRPELPGAAIGRLGARHDVEVTVRAGHEPIDRDEMIALLDGCDAALITGMDPVGADVVAALGDRMPGVISSASVGLDHVDRAATAEVGTVVLNVATGSTESCADFAVGLMLAARRRIVDTDRRIRAGTWTHNTMHRWLGHEIHGARLGLVGFGAIGRAVARRAAGFGMDVVHHDRSGSAAPGSRWVDLDELVTTSDVISLHVPLSPATRHLVDERLLAAIRPDATLVNTSRGAVVDTDALVAALAGGTLGSAGLDVFELEPIDADHPLCALPNVVLAPHAASATTATRSAVVDAAVTNLLTALGRDDDRGGRRDDETAGGGW